MPKKRKSNIGRNSREAKRLKLLRTSSEKFDDGLENIDETDLSDEIRVKNREIQKIRRQNENIEERKTRSLRDRERHRVARQNESELEREERLASNRVRIADSRGNESELEREERLASNRERIANLRENESELEKEVRLASNKERIADFRENESELEREERLVSNRERIANLRENESELERQERLASNRERVANLRENESELEREERLASNRVRNAFVRENESVEEREKRLASDRNNYLIANQENDLRRMNEAIRLQERRDNETEEQILDRQEADRRRQQISREVESNLARRNRLAVDAVMHRRRANSQWRHKANTGFSYSPDINYSEAASIGEMNKVCHYCQALTWKGEAKGICCSSGKVRLPSLAEPPEPLRSLLNGDLPQSENFLQNVRVFNSAFQMTSFGANEVYESGFRPTFRIQGQVYHLIGSLLPSSDLPSSYLQIYFISDANRQVERRTSIFGNLDQTLVFQLQELLHEHNSYVRSFKTALETLPSDSENHRIMIKADRVPVGDHAGRYNAPNVSEVAIIMVGEPSDRRDIILQRKIGNPFRMCETHRSYDALQYPLMFCRGEDGYHFLYRHVDPTTGQFVDKKTSALEFYAYRLMIRENDSNHLHQFRQLFNQFLVDMFAKIESERLLYIRTHQTQLRAEKYIHLQDAIRREEDVESLGQVVILPSSFTGGPRYMHSRTQDAFCYVRKFGRPALFITITTNPKWTEINTHLFEGQSAQDRHDVVSRVFHLKLKVLMALLHKGEIFGPVRCFIYTVEWQKRGLPHAHILIWLEEQIRPNQIDQVIGAELPNPEEDKKLFDLVKGHMVHGPCGPFNHQSGCMKEGRCTKRYPKVFVNETISSEDGYPTYRRRSPEVGGISVPFRVRGETITLDNRWIVPYSPILLRTFETHINVEFCGGVKAIGYICKYVNKGSDQATIGITNEKDETKKYQTGRYISTSESVWRILEFPIHERYPPVIHLDVHLENGQRVLFRPENVLDRVESPTNTTLMAFFKLCQVDNFAKTLLYCEVPSYFTFNKSNGRFARRKKGKPVPGHVQVFKDPAIGRVFTIHPQNSECFHLRLLLHHVRGPTSFEDIKTISGEIYPTFKAACKASGLLEDDVNWEDALREAAMCDSSKKLRELFAIMVVFCDLSDPTDLWLKFRDSFAGDFLRDAQRLVPSTTFENAPHLYGLCLASIEEVTIRIGNKTLSDCHLPPSLIDHQQGNIDLMREMSYNVNDLLSFVTENEPKLTNEQTAVYESVLSNINSDSSKQMFFLDAPGGTGKTFLIKLMLAKIRSQGKIAIAVASSGIAATLLPGGRTAHSMFKIPINIEQMETPVCSVSRNSTVAEVLKECVLIVWDECTMAHKKSIEALDRTLKDIRSNTSTMGGLTILFSGDFRQTLPVVSRGTRADEINASIKKSSLWRNINRLNLSINMRVHLGGEQGAQQFSDLLMKIGQGDLEENDGVIDIPSTLCTIVTSQEELIESVFPGVDHLPNIPNSWLCDRAILTPTNEQAAIINNKILSSFEAGERKYLSINTPMNEDNFIHYPVEFLESINAPGIPAHELNIKIGAPIMLLRNINPPKLCNGTRLRVRNLHRFVIEADILTGCAAGETVFVPRIPLIPSNYPFEFKRLQFPISICFAMTVNKSQGQTLSTAGIDVSRVECFSHGQLYVSCSRVRSSNCLFIFAQEGRTKNIVYKEVLS